LADLVKAAVLQTLDRFDGNRTQAAQCLGISVRTLQRKLKQWRGEYHPQAKKPTKSRRP
jgi:DNA-binding NtrC family response regulator